MKKFLLAISFLAFVKLICGQILIKNLGNINGFSTSFVITPDEKIAYITFFNRPILKYDLNSGKIIDSLKFHKGPVSFIDISAENLIASAGWDRTIVLWKAGSNTPLATLKQHGDKVNCVKFSKDGRFLASGSADGKLIIWDVSTYGIILEIQAHSEPITYISWDSKSKIIATASWDKKIRLWNVQTGDMIKEFTGHRSTVNHVIFSETDTLLLSSGDDNSVILWSLPRGVIKHRFSFYKQPITSAMFFSNDKQMLSVDYEGELTLCDLTKYNLVSYKKIHTGKIVGFTYFREKHTLYTLGADGNLKIWDLSEFVYADCMKKKLTTIEHLRKPKDEFETTEQYNRRIQEYERKKVSLLEECKKEAILEKQALERQKLENEARRFKWIELSLTNIGTYDADKAEYQIFIGKNKYIVTMRPEDARTFKENWQKAKVRALQKDLGNGIVEYYNLEMEHPVTKMKYMFGTYLTPLTDPSYKLFIELQQQKR